MEALKIWTWNGAYLMFEERNEAQLKPGSSPISA
jgi:predicted amidohydrolase YtcJ